jgi:hypothetical protein
MNFYNYMHLCDDIKILLFKSQIINSGGEMYVLAKHHKMCNLADWSHPSNIISCSRAPVRATEEQVKHRTYTCGECQAPNYSIGTPGRKRLISALCCRSLLSYSGKWLFLMLTHSTIWPSGRTGHKSNKK